MHNLEDNRCFNQKLNHETNTNKSLHNESATASSNAKTRVLPLLGQANFRDLGGYKTRENRTVKWGRLFRSGHLAHLASPDLEHLQSIPLTTIIDFRSEEERANHKTLFPNTIKKEVSLPITPGNLSNENIQQIVTDGNYDLAHQFLLDINEQLVLHNQKEYKTFFREVEQADAPLLFNCTAGKDRTGLAAALLLTALGVDHPTILEDYLLTNHCVRLDLENFTETHNLKNEQARTLKTLFTVNEQFLANAFNQIDVNYGSVERYLVDILEVNIPVLKAKYLED